MQYIHRNALYITDYENGPELSPGLYTAIAECKKQHYGHVRDSYNGTVSRTIPHKYEAVGKQPVYVLALDNGQAFVTSQKRGIDIIVNGLPEQVKPCRKPIEWPTSHLLDCYIEWAIPKGATFEHVAACIDRHTEGAGGQADAWYRACKIIFTQWPSKTVAQKRKFAEALDLEVNPDLIKKFILGLFDLFNEKGAVWAARVPWYLNPGLVLPVVRELDEPLKIRVMAMLRQTTSWKGI